VATPQELKRLASEANRGQNLASPERSTPGPDVSPSRLRSMARQFQEQRRIAETDTSRPEVQRNLPAFQDTKSFGEYLTTLGSLVGTTATGALTSIQASADAIGTGIYEYIRGDEDPVLAAIQAGEEVQEKGFGIGDYRLSGVPSDETALGVFQAIGEPLQKLEQGANIVGNQVRESTGSTALGSATATSITLLPDLIGLRGTSSRISSRSAAREGGRDVARRQGVDPRSPTQEKAEQISARAEELTEGAQPTRGMEEVTRAVAEERKRMKAAVDQHWETLRETDAYVNINDIQPIGSTIRRSLNEQGFDLQDPAFSQVNKRLSELQNLTLPGERDTVNISQLVKFRKRVNANQPKAGTPQAAANQMIKARFDEYLLNDFAAVALHGDDAARANWKNAIDSYKDFKTLFNSKDGRYRVLRQLTQSEVTPEQAKQFIFGANSIQGNKQSSLYVKAIKDLLGEESPSYKALRTEATLDIFEPVLKPDPDIDDLKVFVAKYDKALKKSPSLVNELYGEGASNLRELVKLSRAAIKTQDAGKILDIDVPRTASRLAFGNKLARNASVIQLGASAFRLVGRLRGRAKQRAYLGEVLGYDPNVPLIDKKQLATIEGIRSSSVRAGEQEDEEEEQ